jgi:cytochrome c biogenesis protein
MSLLKDLFSFLRSVRLTISLFLVLAGSAILGTLIPQNIAPTTYRALYGEFAARLLEVLGMTDLYHSGWFIALLVLLTLNLIACSLHRFPKTWKLLRSRQPPLTDRLAKTLPFLQTYEVQGEPHGILDMIRKRLRRRGWSVREERIGEALHLMAQRGRYGKLGVFVTHLGVMVILLGGLLTFSLGFKGYVQIEEGESVARVQERGRGIWRDLGFKVRCDQFQATFYPDGTPKEYRSDLSFLEDGKVVIRGPLRVNHPLRFQGFAFFQSSYGVTSSLTLEASENSGVPPQRIKLELGETAQLDTRKNLDIRPLRYEINHEGEGPAVLLAILRPGMHPLGGWLILNGEPLSFMGWRIKLVEADERQWTGLQVKKDPGVIPVWVGCGLVLVGCIMAFFIIQRRIWIRIGEAGGQVICVLGATSQKGRQVMAERTQELLGELENSGRVRLLEGKLGNG